MIQIAAKWNAQKTETPMYLYILDVSKIMILKSTTLLLSGQTIYWPNKSEGPVGRMSTEGLDLVLKNLQAAFGKTTHTENT